MSVDRITHSVGRIIGPYRLEEEIGRGGMGVVHRAIKADTGEAVALKLMLPEIAANQQFRARFVREASLGSDLDHPNIVPIYDAGDVDGELFLAMRLVEGRDLKQLLEQEGRLDPRRLLAILRQVAAALDAAHESGVVHHDIKPQNILVSDADERTSDLVFVTDFGLVKPAGSESTNSRTGAQVFGSIQYMPPEQVEGLPADGRADVYALGCVLFECLTGRIPFDRPNEVAVLWAHVHEDPARVTDLRPELPGGLDEVVATAMAKRPEDRYLTCGELAEAFEQGLQRTARTLVMPIVKPLVKRVPRRKTEDEVWAPNYFPELSRVRKVTDKTNWLHVTAITSILCLLAAALVHFAHPRGIPGAVGDVAFAVGDSVLSAGKKLGSAFSEDQADAGTAPRTRIGKRSKDAFSTGRTRVITKTVRVPGDAPKKVAAASPEDGAGHKSAASPTALTRTFAFVSSRDGSFDVFLAKANGRGIKQLTAGPASEFDPAISPDGTRVAFARGGYREDLLDCPTGAACPYEGHIYVMNIDGTGLVQLSTGAEVYDREPSWSPDGKSIVFTRWPPETDNADLYLLTEGSDGTWVQSQLTSAPGSETEATFSPDGTRIAYSGDLDTDTAWTNDEPHMWDLFLLSTGGSIQQLTKGAGASTPSFSPDGDRLVFMGRKGIFAMSSDGSDMQRLLEGGGYYTDWSTDGTKVAFQRCGGLTEKCRVMVLEVASGKVEVVADDRGDYDGMPSWGPAR